MSVCKSSPPLTCQCTHHINVRVLNRLGKELMDFYKEVDQLPDSPIKTAMQKIADKKYENFFKLADSVHGRNG